jgi:hypothetical protein
VYATDRNIVIGFPDGTPKPTQFNTRVTTLVDPSGDSDILPGSKDIGAADGDGDLAENAVGGYIWDAALRAGKTLRHHGYFTDYTYYFVPPPLYIPISRTPFASHIPQGPPLKPSLQNHNDIYYRGFDLNVPDRYHYEEWLREFNGYVANGSLPNLEVMSLPLDHTGCEGSNVGGLSTPALQLSDNDYALGEIVGVALAILGEYSHLCCGGRCPRRSRSRGRASLTGLCYFGLHQTSSGCLYVLQPGQRLTIEDLLGLNHLSMFEANTGPMADVFTLTPDLTPYSPIIPGALCAPPVHPDLIPECSDPSVPRSSVIQPLHDSEWWANATKRFDFRRPDGLDTNAYNRLLWTGMKGDVPYPTVRSGKNLREGREQLFKTVLTDPRDSNEMVCSLRTTTKEVDSQ